MADQLNELTSNAAVIAMIFHVPVLYQGSYTAIPIMTLNLLFPLYISSPLVTEDASKRTDRRTFDLARSKA